MLEARFSDYRLIRKLAAGGMAEIFLARRHGASGFFREVVVKRLFPELAEQAAVLRMFEMEAILLSHLSHPSIPQVFDFGCFDGTWYTVMEHVPGHTVADLCQAGTRAGRPLPLAVSVGIVMQLAEALHHVHEARDRAGRPLQIVHRDVNPHNVMVTPDGVVKLLDFGVAESAAHRDAPGTVRGTYSYMSPEQVRGEPLDRRSDIFSVGTLLFELTTTRRLFRGQSPQVMVQVADGLVPHPTSLDPDYPRELEAVVLGALRREHDRRTGTAADLARDLELFARHQALPCGPRAIAEHVQAVFPARAAPEPELGVVGAPPPRRPVYVYRPTEERHEEPSTRITSKVPADAPDPGVLLDDGLDATDYAAGMSALQGFEVPPPAERPVVVLEKAKGEKQASSDGEYVRELQSRLEADESTRR